MKKKKRKLIRIIAFILFAIGFALFAYPFVMRGAFDIQAKKEIEQFDKQNKDKLKKDNADKIPYAELRKAMFKYNKKLYSSGQSGLIDQLSYEKPDFLLSDYGINSDILGYITIPSINVKLPVYNGASTENMAKGATYLAHTSLPVGGKNTNCVIAAHNWYNGIYIFQRITELHKGDEIYITNFWETLVYKVVETRIIDPGDSKNIYIQPNRSLVTLSTCYPFPGNYQRYLVYAELVNN